MTIMGKKAEKRKAMKARFEKFMAEEKRRGLEAQRTGKAAK